jgi:hypothetical protein
MIDEFSGLFTVMEGIGKLAHTQEHRAAPNTSLEKGGSMSRLAMRLFGKLYVVIVRKWRIGVSMVGGLALGLSALAGMLQSFQSSHPLDARIEIHRQTLYKRVQRVRDALQTTERASMDRTEEFQVAQWYNWGNWQNGWNKYRS